MRAAVYFDLILSGPRELVDVLRPVLFFFIADITDAPPRSPFQSAKVSPPQRGESDGLSTASLRARFCLFHVL